MSCRTADRLRLFSFVPAPEDTPTVSGHSTTCEQRLRRDHDAYLARDFVETREGLLLAVVANGLEDERVVGCLRYVRCGASLEKLGTADANQLLQTRYPDYVHHSRHRDIVVHGVPQARITRHFLPSTRFAEILAAEAPDPLERKVIRLANIIRPQSDDAVCLGISGSLLVGAQCEESDIDLVCYGRAGFEVARRTPKTHGVKAALEAYRLHGNNNV